MSSIPNYKLSNYIYLKKNLSLFQYIMLSSIIFTILIYMIISFHFSLRWHFVHPMQFTIRVVTQCLFFKHGMVRSHFLNFFNCYAWTILIFINIGLRHYSQIVYIEAVRLDITLYPSSLSLRRSSVWIPVRAVIGLFHYIRQFLQSNVAKYFSTTCNQIHIHCYVFQFSVCDESNWYALTHWPISEHYMN